MSATDELRKLLDERGVEWKAYDVRVTCQTWWTGAHGILWNATEVNGTGRNALNIKTANLDVTPAQAIEATLGRGVCLYVPDQQGFTWWDEDDTEHYEEDSADYECYSASCDKCGFTMMVGDDGWFDGWDEIKEWSAKDGSEHKGYVLEPRFKFCPNCGAKVVEG